VTDDDRGSEEVGVKSQTLHPCGCEETELTSGTVTAKPCLGHALYQAGMLLREAGERLLEEKRRLEESGR
jgi:hypothetical protein